MKPKWYLLLEEQRYGKGITAQGPAGTGRLGLTVSFLLGALRSPSGVRLDRASIATDLRRLLSSMMIEHSSGFVARIYECGTLRQPTACLSDLSSASLGGPVMLPDGAPSKLFAWPQYFSGDSRDLESLIGRLLVLLEGPVGEGRFSYRQGSYQPFNVDDTDFITRAFARDAEDI